MAGELLFLWVFDAAYNMAIDTIWQKYTIWQKSGVSAIVCEYFPSWEPPVSRFRATPKWYFPPLEPPLHLVAAYFKLIFFKISL